MALANHLLHTFGVTGQFWRYAVSILPCTVKLQIGDEQGAEETLCSEQDRWAARRSWRPAREMRSNKTGRGSFAAAGSVPFGAPFDLTLAASAYASAGATGPGASSVLALEMYL
jgi:hypothetical protein